MVPEGAAVLLRMRSLPFVWGSQKAKQQPLKRRDNGGTTEQKDVFLPDSAKFRKYPIIPVQTSVCTCMFLSVPEP